MAASLESNVDLGFVEKTESWRLLSHFFPSKVGGKAAWLSLSNIPDLNVLKCGICGKNTAFLLQVYAPISKTGCVSDMIDSVAGTDTNDRCFHRTVFVFVCKNPQCCQNGQNANFIVLRSQLSRRNDFYSEEPPNEDTCPAPNYPTAAKYESLCEICGCKGDKRCAKCHQRSYCSREHQAIDWKGGHKGKCPSADDADRSASYIFPEFELVMEQEVMSESKSEKSEAEKLEEFESFMKTNTEGLPRDLDSDKDLEAMASGESVADKQFLKFKKRVKQEPDQVLRYEKGGIPLWVSDKGMAEAKDIPPCECGADRQFEFQVLPQVLMQLNVDSMEKSLDWGTLAIYTCAKSCDIGNKYKKEFLWKQDIMD